MDVQRTAATEIVIRGGEVLLPGRGFQRCDVVVDGGNIIEITPNASYAGAQVVDAGGSLVLPGIVDIHGDAFERQIMPRPKTLFPLELATLETDSQLAANGITTAFHGITISWEPGLRSLPEAQRIIAAIDAAEPLLLVDNRLHLRWETYAIDEVPAVIQLMQRAKRPVLAFNDHTTPTLAGSRNDSKVKSAAERGLVDVPTYLNLLDAQGERQSEISAAIDILADIANETGITMLSHDDTSADMRKSFRSHGVRIAEFPMNWETIEYAASNGDIIVLGSPNVVRGGSHNGSIGAEEAVRRGQCHVLASDYYYPAPLNAAFGLANAGAMSLADAWSLVSSAPARATGLADRGQIAPGLRADLIVVRRDCRRPLLTMSGGRIVYRAD